MSGDASDGRGQLAITEPSVISTRSEAELLHRARGRQTWFTVAAGVGVVAGVVLLVAGLLG